MYKRRNTALSSSNLGSLEARERSNKKTGISKYRLIPQKFKNSVKIKINQPSEQKLRSLSFHSHVATEAVLSKLK